MIVLCKYDSYIVQKNIPGNKDDFSARYMLQAWSVLIKTYGLIYMAK